MTVLITGANGFIGRALVSELQNDHAIRIAVRSKASHVFNHLKDVVTVPSLSETFDWKPLVQGCDAVIHTAARVHVLKENAMDPLAAFREVNVQGTMNLARQAAEAGVRRFIFISSIGVNGSVTSDVPFSEKDAPNPKSDYARSKLEAENALLQLASESRMEVVIIRPPLVYGSDAVGNIHRLLKLVAKRLPLPLASVKNKRSFIHRESLVQFIRLCLHHPKAANEIFVIADGVDLSTPQLIQTLARGINKPAILIPFPVSVLKFFSRLFFCETIYHQLCGSLQVDSSKAKALLNWIPPVNREFAE